MVYLAFRLGISTLQLQVAGRSSSQNSRVTLDKYLSFRIQYINFLDFFQRPG